MYVGSTTTVREQLIQHAHDSPVGGHSDYDKTLYRARRDFYWPGMKKQIRQYIQECHTCQQVKHENLAPGGLLQPLPIPDRAWSHITMDFIEGLPISHNYSVLYVVVDRLSKYAHFIPLSHPYTASKVAMAFMHSVFKLHGLPESIISDRDPTFTSTFWNTAYHPQTDGQTKIVKKMS